MNKNSLFGIVIYGIFFFSITVDAQENNEWAKDGLKTYQHFSCAFYSDNFDKKLADKHFENGMKTGRIFMSNYNKEKSANKKAELNMTATWLFASGRGSDDFIIGRYYEMTKNHLYQKLCTELEGACDKEDFEKVKAQSRLLYNENKCDLFE